MNSHLDRFGDWVSLAHSARYRAEEVARLSAVSVRHLERYFRQRFGKPPHVWLEELRLQEACGLLQQRRFVKTVAFELGFKDVPHFCRSFKRRYGLTPLAFIAQLRNQSRSDPVCRVPPKNVASKQSKRVAVV